MATYGIYSFPNIMNQKNKRVSQPIWNLAQPSQTEIRITFKIKIYDGIEILAKVIGKTSRNEIETTLNSHGS